MIIALSLDSVISGLPGRRHPECSAGSPLWLETDSSPSPLLRQAQDAAQAQDDGPCNSPTVAIGEPWQKDTTPVKARYGEKWIYSCETDKGLTYDCVYLYFMGGKVKNVGTMFNMPNEY